VNAQGFRSPQGAQEIQLVDVAASPAANRPVPISPGPQGALNNAIAQVRNQKQSNSWGKMFVPLAEAIGTTFARGVMSEVGAAISPLISGSDSSSSSSPSPAHATMAQNPHFGYGSPYAPHPQYPYPYAFPYPYSYASPQGSPYHPPYGSPVVKQDPESPPLQNVAMRPIMW
jgi:hypothetical protein